MVKKVKKISPLIQPGMGVGEAYLHLEHNVLLCLLSFKKSLMSLEPVKSKKIMKIMASTSLPQEAT